MKLKKNLIVMMSLLFFTPTMQQCVDDQTVIAVLQSIASAAVQAPYYVSRFFCVTAFILSAYDVGKIRANQKTREQVQKINPKIDLLFQEDDATMRSKKIDEIKEDMSELGRQDLLMQ